MGVTVRSHSASTARLLLGIGLISAGAVTVAACGSSRSTGSSGSPASGNGGASASAPAAASNAGAASASVTISARSVSGLGTVLVNQKGQTLYMLTSEKGDKITCTASSGCLHAWPETDLPSGATAARAGSGVKSSLLGTIKGADGQLEVTYNGWPLYTFIGDSAPGQAKGQALTNFGGTWYVLDTAGDPVTMKAAAGNSGTSNSSGATQAAATQAAAAPRPAAPAADTGTEP